VVDTVADVQQEAHGAGKPVGAGKRRCRSIHGGKVCLICNSLY
jgi:hypothetical protein